MHLSNAWNKPAPRRLRRGAKPHEAAEKRRAEARRLERLRSVKCVLRGEVRPNWLGILAKITELLPSGGALDVAFVEGTRLALPTHAPPSSGLRSPPGPRPPSSGGWTRPEGELSSMGTLRCATRWRRSAARRSGGAGNQRLAPGPDGMPRPPPPPSNESAPRCGKSVPACAALRLQRRSRQHSQVATLPQRRPWALARQIRGRRRPLPHPCSVLGPLGVQRARMAPAAPTTALWPAPRARRLTAPASPPARARRCRRGETPSAGSARRRRRCLPASAGTRRRTCGLPRAAPAPCAAGPPPGVTTAEAAPGPRTRRGVAHHATTFPPSPSIAPTGEPARARAVADRRQAPSRRQLDPLAARRSRRRQRPPPRSPTGM